MKKLFALALCAISAISMAGGSVPLDHRRAWTYFSIAKALDVLGVKDHSAKTEELSSKLFQCENPGASARTNCFDGLNELGVILKRLEEEKPENKKLIENLMRVGLHYAGTIPNQSK